MKVTKVPKVSKLPVIPESSYNYIYWGSILLLILPFAAITVYILSTKSCEKFENHKFSLEYFYMEKCPHCVSFHPIWKQLEKEVKGKKYNITLKKYDISEDDSVQKVADYNINSAPTIILSGATKGDHIEYSGERSVKALIEFIESNTK